MSGTPSLSVTKMARIPSCLKRRWILKRDWGEKVTRHWVKWLNIQLTENQRFGILTALTLLKGPENNYGLPNGGKITE